MITKCPHCNTKFKVRDDLKGKKAKCPKCRQPFTIQEFLAESKLPPDKRDVVEEDVQVCAKCGKTIGKLEKSYPSKGVVVCAECDRKLRRKSELEVGNLTESELASLQMNSNSELSENAKDEVISEILGLDSIEVAPPSVIDKRPEAEGTIGCECTRCEANFKAERKMLGHPDICPNCKNVTLVTELKAKVKKQAIKRDQLKELCTWLRGCGIVGIAVIPTCGRVTEVSLPPELVLLAVILGAGAWISSSVITHKARILERKWALELEPKVETKRRKICDTVLELRASGKSVDLCDKCIGTGYGGLLACRKCNGRGYVEY